MSDHKVLEGTWEDVLASNAAELAGRHVRIYIDPEEEISETLDAAISRLNSRTPEQIAATRERILAATPEPQSLPQGKSLSDMITGMWPGDETDEQISKVLQDLS